MVWQSSLTQCLSRGCGQMLVGAAVIWRLDVGWRICFQSSSLTQKVSLYWLLVGGFSSSPAVALYKVAWMSSQHGEWLPPASKESNPKEQGRHCKAFQTLVLEVTHLHLCWILLVTQASHNWMKMGTHKDMNIHRGVTLETILEAGYHVGHAKCYLM